MKHTYYMSPNGNDASSGTDPGSPWQTLSQSVLKMGPGDTLILLDGVYDYSKEKDAGGATGVFKIDNVHGTVKNGSILPVTIKAQNDKQAILQGPGYYNSQSLLVVTNSSYIYLEGLKIQDSAYHGVLVGGSTKCLLKGLEACRPATNHKDCNGHPITIGGFSSDNVIEDCLALEFHRHGIDIYADAQGNVVRRCYVNGMGYPPGASAYGAKGGVTGIACYLSDNNTIEDCVVEDVLIGFDNKGGRGNKFTRCIAIHSNNYQWPQDINEDQICGFRSHSEWIDGKCRIAKAVFTDCVAYGGKNSPLKTGGNYGFWLEGVRKTALVRCAALSQHSAGYRVTDECPIVSANPAPTVTTVLNATAIFRKCRAWNNEGLGWKFDKPKHSHPIPKPRYVIKEWSNINNKLGNLQNGQPSSVVVIK